MHMPTNKSCVFCICIHQLKHFKLYMFKQRWNITWRFCPIDDAIKKTQYVSCILKVKCSRHIIWAYAWQNQQNDMCTQQSLRSAWASLNAQIDLSLRWAHRSFLLVLSCSDLYATSIWNCDSSGNSHTEHIFNSSRKSLTAIGNINSFSRAPF